MSDDADVIALDRARDRCSALLASGARCRNHAGESGRCRVHEVEPGATTSGPPRRSPGPRGSAPRRASATGGQRQDASGPRPRRRSLIGAVAEPDRSPEQTAAHHPDGQAGLAPAIPLRRGDGGDGGGGDAVASALSFVRRRLTGDYPVDVFGFDRELTEHVLLPLARPLYKRYWRVRAVGLEHVPSDSGALIVANHSGTLPFDAVMTKLALLDEHPAHRHLRELAADLALRVPFIGPLARKSGNTLAHNEDAVRLLEAGELVGVWPEGFKGIGKPYRDRYKLERFGRGGFVRVALRAGRPIIPVAIIGAEEIYPIVGNSRLLARLFGFPYFPITWQFPLLGPLGVVPLPSKWLIQFGEPIDLSGYGPEAAEDPMLVFELTDRVRDTIQQMLYRNLMGRRSVFF